jgi:diguanylate cyclase (GGDEF)-like protein
MSRKHSCGEADLLFTPWLIILYSCTNFFNGGIMASLNQLIGQLSNNTVPLDFSIACLSGKNRLVGVETSLGIALESDLKVEHYPPQGSVYQDSITGLPNQRFLLDRLGLTISISVSSELFSALLILELNSFKKLNDTLKQSCSHRLGAVVASSVQGRHTIALLDGDVFAVLIENISAVEEDASQQIRLIASKINNALETTFALSDEAAQGNSTIGCSLFGANIIREICLRP